MYGLFTQFHLITQSKILFLLYKRDRQGLETNNNHIKFIYGKCQLIFDAVEDHLCVSGMRFDEFNVQNDRKKTFAHFQMFILHVNIWAYFSIENQMKV